MTKRQTQDESKGKQREGKNNSNHALAELWSGLASSVPEIAVFVLLILLLFAVSSKGPVEPRPETVTGREFVELKAETVTSGANLVQAGDIVDLQIAQRVTGESKEVTVKDVASASDLEVLYVLDTEGKDVAQTGEPANHIILSVPEDEFDEITRALHLENIAVYLLPQEKPSLDTSPKIAISPHNDSKLLIELPRRVWQLDESELTPAMSVTLVLMDAEGNPTSYPATVDELPESGPIRIALDRGPEDATYLSLTKQLPAATAIYLLPKAPESISLSFVDDGDEVIATLPVDRIESDLDQFEAEDDLVLVVLDAAKQSTRFEGVFNGALNAEDQSVSLCQAERVQIRVPRGADDVTYLGLLSKLPAATAFYLLPQVPEQIGLAFTDDTEKIILTLPADRVESYVTLFEQDGAIVLIILGAENQLSRFEGEFHDRSGDNATAGSMQIKVVRGTDDATYLDLAGKLPKATAFYLLPALSVEEVSDASITFSLPVAKALGDDWSELSINTEVVAFFVLEEAAERYVITLDAVLDKGGTLLDTPPYTGASEIVVSVKRGADDATLLGFIHAKENATGFYLLPKE